MLKKFFKFLLFLLVVAFSIGLILTGLYFEKLSKPGSVYKTGINMVNEYVNYYLKVDDRYIFDNVFTIEGNMKMNISSEKYEKEKNNDESYMEKSKIVNNLDKLNASYSVSHDSKSKKLFLNLDEKLNNENLFSGKYLITDSTEYYFVDGILSNYVNGGSGNYFEGLSSEDTTITNIDYLYDFISTSLANNLEKDTTIIKTNLNIKNKDLEVEKLSYEFDNKSIIKLLNGVLSDLKNDEKAYKILSNADRDFKKRKVSETSSYLEKDEKYILNVFCSKFFYKPLRYEVIYHNKNDIKMFSYEGNSKKGDLFYTENGELKYKVDIENKNNNISMNVFNNIDKDLGSIKIERDINGLLFDANLKLEDNIYEIVGSSKYYDYKERESYSNDITVSFKVSEKQVNVVSGEIVFNNKVKASSEINEEIDKVILKSKLDEDTNKKLDNLYNDIKERLKK